MQHIISTPIGITNFSELYIWFFKTFLLRIVVTGKDNIENVISNCEDDGEKSAGSRMLFLMKVITFKIIFKILF